MRIERLKLVNFHGFEKKEISFLKNFTVLIGENSSGKTAILEGIVLALTSYFGSFEGVEDRVFTERDIRFRTFKNNEIINIEPQYPVFIECEAYFSQQLYKWVTQFYPIGTLLDNPALIASARELQSNVSSGHEDLLPIFAYYATSRLWFVQTEQQHTPFSPSSRFKGYGNYLNPNSSETTFVSWFIQMSLAEIKRKKELDVLSSVRRAITKTMEKLGVTNIEYDPLGNGIYVSKQNGEMLPFHLLSDGYRNTIGLVADIAYRMAILNPFLKDHLETPGVVLIDEIDLHLHPKWQRHIVDDLKRTFPHVQFIVTTHSPFIVQSLEEGELRVLDSCISEIDPLEATAGTDSANETKIFDVPSELYVNKSVEDVSEKVMGLEHVQRSEKLQQLYEITKEYYKLIEQEAHATAEQEKERLSQQIAVTKQRLDELSSLFSDNVAFYAMLELERLSIQGRAKLETD